MSDQEFERGLGFIYDLLIQRAPAQHRLRTPQCPPLHRLSDVSEESLTPAERGHVNACAYCQKVVALDKARDLFYVSDLPAARIGADFSIKGEISGSADLYVDGRVEGLIQLEGGKLTVGANAKLIADVVAREVIVYGSVKGNLRARDGIEVMKGASVDGDLTTARFLIQDGAAFKGSIEIAAGDLTTARMQIDDGTAFKGSIEIDRDMRILLQDDASFKGSIAINRDMMTEPDTKSS